MSKTVVVVGTLSGIDDIRAYLLESGYALMHATSGREALMSLTSGEETDSGDVYLIGSNVESQLRNELLHWLSEETDIPFLLVGDSGKEPARYTPYESFEPDADPRLIASRLARYLENV